LEAVFSVVHASSIDMQWRGKHTFTAAVEEQQRRAVFSL
jgi:hypothetical protein